MVNNFRTTWSTFSNPCVHHQTGRLSRSRTGTWPGFFKEPKPLRNTCLCTCMHCVCAQRGRPAVHSGRAMPHKWVKESHSPRWNLSHCPSYPDAIPSSESVATNATLRGNHPHLPVTHRERALVCGRMCTDASPGEGEGTGLTSDVPVFLSPFHRASAV